jgi:hypothetical protein
VIFRTEVQEHERPVPGDDDLDGIRDELFARPVEPVKVLVKQDGRLSAAAGAADAADHVEEPALSLLGPER